MTLQLRNYQTAAVRQPLHLWQNGHKSLLLVMPTGAGKTIVFLEALKRCFEELASGGRALIVCPAVELVNQAVARIGEYYPSLWPVGVVQGDRHQPSARVVVATVQSLHGKRLLDVFRHGEITHLVIDEAHHAVAPTWHRLIKRVRNHNRQVRIMGVTATPERADGKALGAVFGALGFTVSIKYLVEQGYLVRPVERRFRLPVHVRRVRKYKGDYAASALGRVVDVRNANEIILRKWLKYASDRPTIGFTPTIAHARHMAELFREEGIRAAHLSGRTRKDVRQQTIEQFKQGSIQVIWNAQLLTEGFDAPNTSCIIVARPTLSRTMFRQMIGRGLRIAPGKNDCYVLNFAPTDAHDLASVGNVLGGELQPVEPQEKSRRTPKQRKKRTIGETVAREAKLWAVAIVEIVDIIVDLLQPITPRVLREDAHGRQWYERGAADGIFKAFGL